MALAGPLNLSGYPLTLGGNIFSPSTIQGVNRDAGDTFVYSAGGADRFGAGQYSNSRTRVFTSGSAANASVGWSLATATVGIFTDLLVANATSVSSLVPLYSAVASLGNLSTSTLSTQSLTANNAVVSNVLSAGVGNVQVINSSTITSNNAQVSNLLQAGVANVGVLTAVNAQVSNLSASALSANNAVVSNVINAGVVTAATSISAPVANLATLTSSTVTVANLSVTNLENVNLISANTISAAIANLTTINSTTVNSVNSNVSGYLSSATANIANLVVTGTVSLPQINTVSANNASFTKLQAATLVEQGGAVAANASSVVFPLSGDITQIFFKVAGLTATAPAIRMAVSTGNAATFDTAATNYQASIFGQSNNTVTFVQQTGAAYPTLVSGAKGSLATHTVRLNYTGQINDSANGAFTTSLFDMTAVGMADASAGGGVYMNSGTVTYASSSNSLPTFVRFTLENTGNTAAVPSYIRSSYQPITYM